MMQYPDDYYGPEEEMTDELVREMAEEYESHSDEEADWLYERSRIGLDLSLEIEEE